MRIRWSSFDPILAEFARRSPAGASLSIEDDAGKPVASSGELRGVDALAPGHGDAPAPGDVVGPSPHAPFAAVGAEDARSLVAGNERVGILRMEGVPEPLATLCFEACVRELAHQATIVDMADATARLWRQTNALLRMSESTRLGLEPGAMLGRVLGTLAHATGFGRGAALVRTTANAGFALLGGEHPRVLPTMFVAPFEALPEDLTIVPGDADSPPLLSACAEVLGRAVPCAVARIATDKAGYGYMIVPLREGGTPTSEDLKVLGAATRVVGIAVENAFTLQRERDAMRLQVENEMLSGQAREMEEMLHVVSHDLRTPMTAVYGFMHMALDELEDLRANLEEAGEHEVAQQGERIAKPLEDAIRSIERLNGMVQRLLDFSRVARLDYRFEPLNMHDLASGIVDSLSFHAKAKGVSVRIGHLADTEGDRVQIEAVFRNLVDNAIKYMGDGERREILVGSEPRGGEVVYFVRDTGVGMTPEQSGKAFLPFRRFRADAAPGEGIGLSYVRKVVERHGGRIWCESAEGEGTTFYFTLHPPAA